MTEVVVVEAVRSPIGKRNGGLSTFHPADLLAAVQTAMVERSGIDPAEIEQVVGGCISQVGPQAFNVTRTAWLTAGLPPSTACTTVDSQCGSSQQATNIAASFVGSGVVEVAAGCGVEVMSRAPMGSSLAGGKFGNAIPKSYFASHEYTSQFEAAERIAEKWAISRDELDALGVESQRRAAVAWDEGRFETQVVPVDAPVLGDDGKPTGETTTVTRDEGLRSTTLEGLAGLKPVAREENGFHTAGTSSQISDAAAAVLLMSAEKAEALGLRPRARIVDTCLVGSDPTLMLTAPTASSAEPD
jgi:acetyl-CoA C-acetyltransferase